MLLQHLPLLKLGADNLFIFFSPNMRESKHDKIQSFKRAIQHERVNVVII